MTVAITVTRAERGVNDACDGATDAVENPRPIRGTVDPTLFITTDTKRGSM